MFWKEDVISFTRPCIQSMFHREQSGRDTKPFISLESQSLQGSVERLRRVVLRSETALLQPRLFVMWTCCDAFCNSIYQNLCTPVTRSVSLSDYWRTNTDTRSFLNTRTYRISPHSGSLPPLYCRSHVVRLFYRTVFSGWWYADRCRSKVIISIMLY